MLIGAGTCWQTAVEFKDKNSLKNLDIYPLQAEEVPYTMALATLSLVTLDEGAEELMIPKVFYYLAAGSAVIGICKGENELKDIIEGANCGVCVSPGSPKQLANEIVTLIDDKNRVNCYRKNARDTAVSHYSREAGIINLFRSSVSWDGLNWMKKKGNSNECCIWH